MKTYLAEASCRLQFLSPSITACSSKAPCTEQTGVYEERAPTNESKRHFSCFDLNVFKNKRLQNTEGLAKDRSADEAFTLMDKQNQSTSEGPLFHPPVCCAPWARPPRLEPSGCYSSDPPGCAAESRMDCCPHCSARTSLWASPHRPVGSDVTEASSRCAAHVFVYAELPVNYTEVLLVSIKASRVWF